MQNLRKWIKRCVAFFVLIFILLMAIILNPGISYANKTRHNNYNIYHNQALDSTALNRIDEATASLKASELYNSALKLDLCLNDRAAYPKLMKLLRGRAFGWGFYNKIVLQGTADFKNNYVDLDGYRWNLSQLIAHEAMHCMQFDRLGFWKTNPLSSIQFWKMEGYAELVARQSSDQKDLQQNIDRLIKTEKQDNNGWIAFSDGTGTVISYYKAWLLMQFCMQVKKQTYKDVLVDTVKETLLTEKMMNWYSAKVK